MTLFKICFYYYFYDEKGDGVRWSAPDDYWSFTDISQIIVDSSQQHVLMKLFATKNQQ